MTDTANNDFPRKLRKCHNIADLRLAAKSALPYPIFDHVDGGSDDEVTLSANTSAFGKYSLKATLLQWRGGRRRFHHCAGATYRMALLRRPRRRTEIPAPGWRDRRGTGGAQVRHRLCHVRLDQHQAGGHCRGLRWPPLLPAAALPLPGSDGGYDSAGQGHRLQRPDRHRGQPHSRQPGTGCPQWFRRATGIYYERPGHRS